MNFLITNTSIGDLPVIYSLFEDAMLFQKENNYIGWNSYDKEFIKSDVRNGLLFKLINGNNIVCIFSICYRDALIWREKEKGDAIYLHRIILNQKFKGEKVFQKVLAWTIQLAREKKLSFIRMDTWAENEKIIGYYKSYGFTFIENYTTPATVNLPVQHRNLKVALLELSVPPYQVVENFMDNNLQTSSDNLEKVNINQEFSTINKYWSQKIIGEANGQLIKLAKGIGEINWHKHDDQDELFILCKGHLTIQLRNKNIELYANDMFIVPKGIEHCPNAHGNVDLLIMGLNITSDAAGGRPDDFTDELQL